MGNEPVAAERSLLNVTNLSKQFSLHVSALQWFSGHRQKFNAVTGVSLEIGKGESLGLVGPSGCGKSTTAHCILQLLRPSSGSVMFDGVELTQIGPRELRRRRRDIQLVFQDPFSSLNPRRKTVDILLEPMRIHGIGDESYRRARVRELAETVGLRAADLGRYPAEFSGGQRQRIGIARALATRPKLLICDEPVSSLDVSVRAQVLNLLKDLQEQLHLAMLFISHDLSVVRYMCDRVAVMNEGSIVESGRAIDVYQSPKSDYTRSLIAAIPLVDPKRARQQLAQTSSPEAIS